MLKKYLRILFVLSTLTGIPGTSHAVLFQAPLASTEDFQKYALQRNQQTYTQWVQESAARVDFEAHPQVLEFAQQALSGGSPKQALGDWSLLLRSLDLNKADREIFTLLAEKMQWQRELCRYLLLDAALENILEKPGQAKKCQSQTPLLPPSFQKQIQSDELLVVDGRVLNQRQLPAHLMTGTYQWRIISNLHEERRFVGTAEEFSKQKITLQTWVSGECGDYKFAHPELSVLLESQIYFGETCVKPALPPEKNFSNWSAEHKKLLWGLGILAAGITAFQLKDKTLVFTKP